MSRLIIVSFDPGVTTGWAWHAASKESLLSVGAAASLRDMRKDVALGDMSHIGRGLDLGFEFGEIERPTGEFCEDAVTDSQMGLIRQAFVAYQVDVMDTFVVVTEDFILRNDSRDRDLLAPVRLNAKLEASMRGTGLHMFLQQPSDAKRTITDERLKRWNVYQAGSDHIKDAQRHGILFMRRWASQPGLRRAADHQHLRFWKKRSDRSSR